MSELSDDSTQRGQPPPGGGGDPRWFWDIKYFLEIEKIKKNSRNYAKRQLTYFRNKMNVTWISVDTPLSEVDFEHYFSFLGRKV